MCSGTLWGCGVSPMRASSSEWECCLSSGIVSSLRNDLGYASHRIPTRTEAYRWLASHVTLVFLILIFYIQHLYSATTKLVLNLPHRFFNSHHHHDMVVPKFSIANPSFENTPTNPYMNIPNLERPPDTTVNIQRGRVPTQSNTRAPRSPLYSSMDLSPPSEIDYAERMNIESNKMDIEIANQEMEGLYSSSPINYTVQQPPWNEAASNNGTSLDPPTDPVTPLAIPYEANSPADPNLWDGHFGSVSLFSTNEFLQSNARNISCSLIHIAQFIRQRNISNRDGNTIPQLNSFGEAALDFISVIYKAGWNKLNTLDNIPIRHKIKDQFRNHSSTNKEKTKNTTGNIPPHIPPCLPSKQVEEVRKQLNF